MIQNVCITVLLFETKGKFSLNFKILIFSEIYGPKFETSSNFITEVSVFQDTKWETLEPLIRKWVAPGTVGTPMSMYLRWRLVYCIYTCSDSSNKHFVDPRDPQICTQSIESLCIPQLTIIIVVNRRKLILFAIWRIIQDRISIRIVWDRISTSVHLLEINKYCTSGSG